MAVAFVPRGVRRPVVDLAATYTAERSPEDRRGH